MRQWNVPDETSPGGGTLGGKPVDTAIEGGPRGVTTLEVLLGVALTVPLHLFQVLGIPFMAIFYIGISQLPYMVPAVAIAYSKGRPGIGVGLMIGAAFTMLLNAACFVIILGAWE